MIDDFDTIPCDPSAVLPRQISGGGPRALMLAVLEDAVRCIEAGRRRRHFYTRRLAAEAEAWVRCEQRDWPFSFVIICEVLGFDVDAVRARLLTKVHEPAPSSRSGAVSAARTGSSTPCSAWPRMAMAPVTPPTSIIASRSSRVRSAIGFGCAR